MRELRADRPRILEDEDIGGTSTRFLGWRVELIHLGHGPLHRFSVVVPLGEVSVALVHVERAAVLRGVSPKSDFSLLSTSPASPAMRVRSGPVGGGVCLMLGSRASVEIYLPKDCCAFILSAPSASVIAATAPDAVAALPVIGRAELRALATDHTALLSTCMDLMESLRRSAAPDVVAPLLQRRLGELLTPTAARLFSSSHALPAKSDEKAVRRLAVARACAHIDEHLRQPIALQDLCRSAGVRARTLEYGFREFCDVGPMAYLRSVRLCRARRDLLNPRRFSASVTKIARRWSFTHMGQFSRDYRLLFGESPSGTLARTRRSVVQGADASVLRS